MRKSKTTPMAKKAPRKLKAGGSTGCPPGYYVEYMGGPCIKDKKALSGPSVKVAGAVIGSAGAAAGTYLRATSQKVADKQKAKADVQNAEQTLAKSKVMRKGGKLKKMMVGGTLKSVNPSANPGLAKLPTEVRNKMGYKKKGGKVATRKKK